MQFDVWEQTFPLAPTDDGVHLQLHLVGCYISSVGRSRSRWHGAILLTPFLDGDRIARVEAVIVIYVDLG